MNNHELAKIFQQMAYILEIRGVAWKPQAYKKASRSIESLQEDVSDIYRDSGLKGLEEIPGVGEGIAKKIVQFLGTGKVKEYEELKQTIPKPVVDMMRIPGMGPKRARLLYEKLKIRSVEELKEAAQHHRLQVLKSFKDKAEENILKGIDYLKNDGRRWPYIEAMPVAEMIVKRMRRVKGVREISIGGSLRRKEPTIGDIDILVTADKNSRVIHEFVKQPEVERVQAEGMTKASVRFKNGIQADLRVVPEESIAAALQYFTGNKEHNVKIRIIAIKQGYKLSEYGLFKRDTGRRIPLKTEKDLYNKLGMEYISPEKRKNRGEIEEAMRKYER